MHDAAVSTFRVVDTPHHYVRRQLGMDETQQTTATTTTTTETYSDSSQPPSQPYAVQQQPQQRSSPHRPDKLSAGSWRPSSNRRPRRNPGRPRPRAVIKRESAPPTTDLNRADRFFANGERFALRQTGPGKARLCLQPVR